MTLTQSLKKVKLHSYQKKQHQKEELKPLSYIQIYLNIYNLRINQKLNLNSKYRNIEII